MPRSHWAFLPSVMHSGWKLTSSGGVREGIRTIKPSVNNRGRFENRGTRGGESGRGLNVLMLAMKISPSHSCILSGNVLREYSTTNRQTFPNSHQTFADIFILRCIGGTFSEVSANHRRLFADIFKFCDFLEYFCEKSLKDHGCISKV